MGKRGFLLAVACLLLIPAATQASPTLGEISPGYAFSMSASQGRMNWRYTDGVDSSNIQVTDAGLSGQIWSEGLSTWIDLSGVTNDGAGNLGGTATSIATGTIDFSGVTIDSAGYFHGIATNATTGNIRMNCEDDFSCDTNNFRVKTDWVPLALRTDFVGTFELSNSEVSAANAKYILTFTPPSPLPNNGTILLSFPSQYATPFSSLTSSDVAVSAINLASSTITVDTSNRFIYVDVQTLYDISDEITIVIGDGAAGGFNDMTNPAISGQYGVGISLFDSTDDELSSGIAFVPVSNSDVSVNAAIVEALMVTVSSNSISFTVNPGVNSGKDVSQYTEFTIATNSPLGYFIYAHLTDGSGNNRLKTADGDIIATGTGENNFGFEARNAAYSAGESVNADASFASSATLLNSNGADIKNLAPANNQKHTIYYDLDTDYMTPPGQYSGTLIYTITPGF